MWLLVLPEVTPLVLVCRLSQQLLCLTITLLLSARTKAGQGPVELRAVCSTSSLQQKQVKTKLVAFSEPSQIGGWQQSDKLSSPSPYTKREWIRQLFISESSWRSRCRTTFETLLSFSKKISLSLTGVVHKQLVIWYQHGSSAVTEN